jgi:PAS domain S-box-containing protein
MSWHWSGTSLLLVGGAGYLTACAVYVWRYRRGPTAASLVVVLAALAQWGVARAGALAAGDPAIKRVFCDLRYVGLVVLAPAAIVFVLQYAGRLRRPSGVLLGMLAVEPLVVLVVLAIPATRHLFQTCLPSMASDAAPMVRYGPLFWVHFVYFNAATWLCLAAFVETLAHSSRPYHRQRALLLGSLALSLGANLIALLNFAPFGRVDLPALAFVLTVVLLGLAVFRFHLLDLRPIAHGRIFQTSGEGVVVLDLGGKVIEANSAAERLLGQAVTRTVAQPAQRLAPAWTELLQRQRGNGGGEAVDEIADNGRIHEVTVSSLTDHLGWPTGQLVVARDVTEHRRAEQQLRDSLEREQAASRQLRDSLEREQAASRQLRDSLEREQAASQQLRALDQMKGTFLQAVSHDLRTPLASVLGIAVTLQRHQQQLDADDVADLLQRLSKGAHKMDRLLNDLLDLDRLAQPEVSPEREQVDLGELVERVVKDVRAELPDERPLHVEVCPLRLAVDPPKVERIVENLLANAARHTQSGTPIWVRIRPYARGALLIVEDAGPGVPAPLREAIFQPFRQGPRRASHAPGLGVGLALVRVFAQLHGGSAWVEERQGGGASFRVHLPDPSYGMR